MSKDASRDASRDGYDPVALGAKCNACPLQGQHKPVGPTYSTSNNPIGMIIAESPGAVEIFEGKPLVGPTGRQLNYVLRTLGTRRDQFHLTNATKCEQPRGMIERDWKQAVRCCHPLLKRELRETQLKWIQPMGKPALYAALGHTKLKASLGFVTERGGSASGSSSASGSNKGLFILPNWHPTFALIRSPKHRIIFGEYLRRFIEMSRGRMPVHWDWAESHIGCTKESLNGLKRLYRWVVSEQNEGRSGGLCLDVENLPSQEILTCVGLSNGVLTVAVPWDTYINGDHGVVAGLTGSALGREILRWLKRILKRTGFYAHNGAHDVSLFEKRGIKTKLEFDTYVAHSIVYPQHMHNLEDVALQFFPMDRWKKAFHSDTDTKGADDFVKKPWVDLARYNVKDCVAGYVLVEPLRDLLSITKGWDRYERKVRHCFYAKQCCDYGVKLDGAQLKAHRAKLTELSQPYKDQVVSIGKKYGMGSDKDDGWNPSSARQLGELLYDRIGERCFYYTATNGRGVGSKALARIRDQGDTKIGREVCRAMENFRHLEKLRSSYVDKLLSIHADSGDGVYHHDLNPCGPQTGRWSSFIHTIPRNRADSSALHHIPIRDCFTAREGRFLVDVDFSQLELRAVALLAREVGLINAYAKGEDVHKINALNIFGDVGKRQLAKPCAYQVNYGSSDLKRCSESVWEKVKVYFPDLKLNEVRAFVYKWFELYPSLHRWRINQLARAETYDYSEEPFSGRRRYYYGKVKETEVFNFPVQTLGGHIMDEALDTVWPYVDWDRLAVLFPWHDALVCDTSDPGYAWDVLMGCDGNGGDSDGLKVGVKNKYTGMVVTLEYRGCVMEFPVEFEIGLDLKNLVTCGTRDDVLRFESVVSRLRRKGYSGKDLAEKSVSEMKGSDR